MIILSPSFGVSFNAWLAFPYPIPPACIITLSNPSFLDADALEEGFSSCSKVRMDPVMSGCPNLFPKSEAPFDAFIKISMGVWYNQCRSFIFCSQNRSLVKREYDVIYTAVPAKGRDPFPPANRSLISPPDPVAAPLKGSTVVGKLWVSAFKEITESNFSVL